MCGIAGILDRRGRPVERDHVERMIRSIAHRGPDDDGVFADGPVGLGSARLAIIDLSSAGHQPMTSADGRYTLVYNGELYNYRELAGELRSRGHPFVSRSDTEVVLRAWQEWGAGCLERFDGMFAFAVWDAQERELSLVRDRFGIKPLYYAEVDGRLLFGSEIKSLLAAGLGVSVSADALREYFTFQNLFSDRTLFEGVRTLPAGHLLRANGHDGTRIERWWDLVLEPDESVSENEWVERLRDAFASAVERQLVADVPLGSYLSGGMDSASIVAVASARIPRLMTFTGGFDLSSVTGLELVFDERADAERVASACRTEHYEMVLHAGDMMWVLPELVWHLEDLRVGMSYPNHYIARLASKFVKVALAGTGGDELFAGYPWRYELVDGADDADEFERRHYAYWSRLVPEEEHDALFTAGVRGSFGDPPRDAYRRVLEPAAELDPVAKALYFEAKTFLQGLLVVEDRVSMAHSLEVRVPFLDNELVEIARRIPTRLKHRDGGGKPLLRRAMAGLLPEEIVGKPKQGFSPPDESWYRGPSMTGIRELLLSRRALERGYFEPAYVRRVLDEHHAGRQNHRLLIWSLICFEWWNRLFLEGDATTRHDAWHAATVP